MPEILMLSQNARGMQEKPYIFTHTLKEFLRWNSGERALGVLCIQDHNMPPSRKANLTRLAKTKGVTLLMTSGHVDAQGDYHGGVLMMIKDAKFTLLKVLDEQPRLIRAEIEFGDRILEVASVYAPSDPSERVDFLKEVRDKKMITNKTIPGGDWNVVEDKTLDVLSSNPLGYENAGIQILQEITTTAKLRDIRREQLGNKREYTRGGETSNGYTMTRIDRWYVPENNDLLFTSGVTNEFVFKAKASDHHGVWLRIEDRQGEIGRDRESIQEDLLQDPAVQDHVRKLVREAYQGSRSKVNKWIKANNTIRDYLMRETKKRRKSNNMEAKKWENVLRTLGAKRKSGGGSAKLDRAEKELTKKIQELRYPEIKREITEKQAHQMFERSDRCTAAMFKPYKDQAKQQWINKVAKTEWTEGVEPWPDQADLDNAEKTSTTKEVGAEFVKLYKMIFDKKVIHIDKARDLLTRMRRKAIQKASRDALEEDITEDEVAQTMENLPTGKQAGPNRIPNAVYKYMSSVFAPLLTEILNESTTAGSLPRHFLEGDIAMLFKKNDRTDPRNYRPITLLNTD